MSKRGRPEQVTREFLERCVEYETTKRAAANVLGVTLAAVQTACRRHGINLLIGPASSLPKPVRPPKPPDERVLSMVALYRAGKTLQQIGEEYGITRERVRQLMTERAGITAVDGGAHLLALKNAAARTAKADARSLKRWGCTFDQYRQLRELKKPTRAFSRQRLNAANRGIAWELTLWQWWSIWQQSGKWPLRGRAGYVMCRHGDVGPYSLANVFIATARENCSDKRSKRSGLPRGVTCAGRRYIAQASISGVKHRIGSFDDPDLAHAAYLQFITQRTAPLQEAA